MAETTTKQTESSDELVQVQKTKLVTCPKCGRQYLLQDIFYETDFFGVPENLVRDPLGKIIYVDYKRGYEPCYTQSYVCDECNETFNVEVNLTVKTRVEDPELNFSNQYCSLL